jgi:phage shock protein A
MVKVDLCSTKERLLAEYDRATEKYLDALHELRANMATSPKPLYDRLLQASEDARSVSERARIALERHVAEHGC